VTIGSARADDAGLEQIEFSSAIHLALHQLFGSGNFGPIVRFRPLRLEFDQGEPHIVSLVGLLLKADRADWQRGGDRFKGFSGDGDAGSRDSGWKGSLRELSRAATRAASNYLTCYYAHWVAERRGFEPLTSAVQHPCA
jgi:hypothetical protein